MSATVITGRLTPVEDRWHGNYPGGTSQQGDRVKNPHTGGALSGRELDAVERHACLTRQRGDFQRTLHAVRDRLTATIDAADLSDGARAFAVSVIGDCMDDLAADTLPLFDADLCDIDDDLTDM